MKKTSIVIVLTVIAFLSLISFDYSFSWYASNTKDMVILIAESVFIFNISLLASLTAVKSCVNNKAALRVYLLMLLAFALIPFVDLNSGYITGFLIPITILINSVVSIVLLLIKKGELNEANNYTSAENMSE